MRDAASFVCLLYKSSSYICEIKVARATALGWAAVCDRCVSQKSHVVRCPQTRVRSVALQSLVMVAVEGVTVYGMEPSINTSGGGRLLVLRVAAAGWLLVLRVAMVGWLLVLRVAAGRRTESL